MQAPLLLAHANGLRMKRKAHYPVIHTQTKTFTASSGAQQVSTDGAFFGRIPERFLYHLLKRVHSLVLQDQIHSTFIII